MGHTTDLRWLVVVTDDVDENNICSSVHVLERERRHTDICKCRLGYHDSGPCMSEYCPLPAGSRREDSSTGSLVDNL